MVRDEPISPRGGGWATAPRRSASRLEPERRHRVWTQGPWADESWATPWPDARRTGIADTKIVATTTYPAQRGLPRRLRERATVRHRTQCGWSAPVRRHHHRLLRSGRRETWSVHATPSATRRGRSWQLVGEDAEDRSAPSQRPEPRPASAGSTDRHARACARCAACVRRHLHYVRRCRLPRSSAWLVRSVTVGMRVGPPRRKRPP